MFSATERIWLPQVISSQVPQWLIINNNLKLLILKAPQLKWLSQIKKLPSSSMEINFNLTTVPSQTTVATNNRITQSVNFDTKMVGIRFFF